MEPPEEGYTLFCCDRASFGNPENIGFGVVVRNNIIRVIGIMSGGIGIATNCLAEVYAVLCALEWVVLLKISKVIIRSDFKPVTGEFNRGFVSWYIKI